ncbi:hypothetical protein BKA62DRAFT_679410 [Auriculariales sp. MPI-PUGE-AT-0066]|nr:hypothetical protein BKA62DRAFT_679410 [Auriculariales sp. MPI-PUGE-AT-0066]
MSSTLMAQRATALQNYMTQLATAVQNQLSNPDGSTVCAHCVNVLRVLHAKDEKLALELRSSQRGLYDGLIRCITSVQHARDIDDFRQRVEETSRICNRTHQRQIPSQGLFQHSVRSMFGIIEDAFVGKSSPSAIANGSSQYPTNARKFFRSSCSTHLLSPNREKLLWTLIQSLRAVQGVLPDDDSSWPGGKAPCSLPSHLWFASNKQDQLSSVTSAALIIHVLFLGPGGSEMQLRAFVKGYATVLANGCEAGARTLPKSSSFRVILANCSTMFHLWGRSQYRPTSLPLPTFQQAYDQELHSKSR